MFSIIHRNKQKLKLFIAILFICIGVLTILTDNPFYPTLFYFIGIVFLSSIYISQFMSIINKQSADLGMEKFSDPQKFLLALLIIFSANIIWIPNLTIVAAAGIICSNYLHTPEEIIKNTGCILLITIPLSAILIDFYSFKKSIIKYKNYFRAASTFIFLCFLFIFLIDSYWPLNIVSLLKDTHSWGIVLTTSVFRFLIEIHTRNDN